MMPRNAIIVLMDSLNRHLIGAYGGTEFATPNLDRFAERALRFDTHYSGSLPCIPARHDLLCGALDFLWRPWGSIEVWESAFTAQLRDAGVATMLVTDHPHLFEVGGENYHTDFTAWDYLRGHESDPWKTRPDPSWIGAPQQFHFRPEYHNSRGYFRGEADFPGPRTMSAAARWLEEHARHHDRFLLFVDEFDPHEPFDTPEPYASMYDPDFDGERLIWPPYVQGAVAHGLLSPAQARQLRAAYGGKLTMIDAWFGRVLDAIDRQDLWRDTAIIVCTDHGHYLGEKDIWGKPGVPLYEPMSHTPLFIAWPGMGPRPIPALTTNVDIHATMLDIFGARAPHHTHGRSLVPLIHGEADHVREYALAGVWGREVHFIDGVHKYARAPVGENAPLGVWSNRWSTMPDVHIGLRMPPPDERATLDRMPGTRVPVIHQPYIDEADAPYWAWGGFSGHHLYALRDDPAEEHNLVSTALEQELEEKLRRALVEIEAPREQFVRLGLA